MSQLLKYCRITSLNKLRINMSVKSDILPHTLGRTPFNWCGSMTGQPENLRTTETTKIQLEMQTTQDYPSQPMPGFHCERSQSRNYPTESTTPTTEWESETGTLHHRCLVNLHQFFPVKYWRRFPSLWIKHRQHTKGKEWQKCKFQTLQACLSTSNRTEELTWRKMDNNITTRHPWEVD